MHQNADALLSSSARAQRFTCEQGLGYAAGTRLNAGVGAEAGVR